MIEKITIEGTTRPPNTVITETGKAIAALIEARLTYLNIKKIRMNTPRLIRQANGCAARITPNKVAIPFPPLKPAKTGKMCPITAATPNTIWRSTNCEVPVGASEIKPAITTASHPLRMSRNSTINPALLPSTRKVLVAPALPLPNSRTSTPYNDLPIQTADGIEPIR